MRNPLVTCGAALGILVLSACGQTQPSDVDVRTITVWRHNGTVAESDVFRAQVRDFNASHRDVHVVVRTIAEGDYNDDLQAAAARGALPDIAEVDGPLVASYVHQGQLVPLDGLLPARVLRTQLPSLKSQGTIKGRRYAVGVFDSGLGLYADRRQLKAAGIDEWPTRAADAWTSTEFDEVLSRLAAHDPDGKVLDLKLNYGTGEWLTYGFEPLVASAGGELIDPSTMNPAGHFDGPATRQTLQTLAGWAPYVDPNTKDEAFTHREVALSWVGHWLYRDYAKALGDDLAVLPLPDLGNGSKSGQGSWSWTITKRAKSRPGAAQFLRYLLRTEQVLRMTNANAAVPGTVPALRRSGLYRSGGPLRMFALQLIASCGHERPSPKCVAVPRPVTPGYPTLSAEFASAVHAALTGGDWEAELRSGSTRAKSDFKANDEYR